MEGCVASNPVCAEGTPGSWEAWALGQGWGGGLCTQVQAKLSGIPRRRAAHSRNGWNQGSSAPSGRVIGGLLFGKTKHLL